MCLVLVHAEQYEGLIVLEVTLTRVCNSFVPGSVDSFGQGHPVLFIFEAQFGGVGKQMRNAVIT